MSFVTHFYPQELPVQPVARYQNTAPQDGSGYSTSPGGTVTQPTGVPISPVPFPDAPNTSPPANANRTDCSANTANLNPGTGTNGSFKNRWTAEQTLVTIIGVGLTNTARVNIGADCGNLTVVDDTQVTCTIANPRPSKGFYDVIVEINAINYTAATQFQIT